MKQKITADTVIISAFSMVLQLLSIALNIVITKNMGESAVGILSLVSQFFVFALTLSNGNIF
ncbi:MAG: polysaccharide biosynthesis protein, partial [Oscillospiraceae bacterium]|nr:polysaccharide biosynthesis protein [Oscillospiraceae bacterium]